MTVVDRAIKILERASEQRLKKRPPNTFTLQEYMVRTGLTRRGSEQQMRRLLATKKVRRIWFPQKERTGRIVSRIGYQLL